MGLVADKKYYKIKGKEFYVKKFGIAQGSRFMKLVARVVVTGADAIQGISDKLEKSENNASDMLMILNVLGEDDISEFVAICLNTDDVEFVKENVDLNDLAKIVGDVFELNDFGGLVKNFSRTVERVTKQLSKEKKK